MPRRSAPYYDVAVRELEASGLIGSFETTEQEDRWDSERDGNDWLGEIFLVLVLMRRKARTDLVAINETCIRHEFRKSSFRRSRGREPEERFRHARPRPATLRIDGVIAISGSVCHPAKRAAVRHRDRHAITAGRDHLTKRSSRRNITNCGQDRRFILPHEFAQDRCPSRQWCAAQFLSNIWEQTTA